MVWESIENRQIALKAKKREELGGTPDSANYETHQMLRAPEQIHQHVDREPSLKAQFNQKRKIAHLPISLGDGDYRSYNTDLTYTRPEEPMTFLKFLVALTFTAGGIGLIINFICESCWASWLAPIVQDKSLLIDPNFWLTLLHNPFAFGVAALILVLILWSIFKPKDE